MSSLKRTHPSQNRMSWIEMAYPRETSSKPADLDSDVLANQSETNSATGEPDKAAEASASCSFCGHPYLRSQSKAVPFCSIRCQQIDLGLWLDERLGLPIEGHEEQEFTGFDDDDS